MRLDLSQQLKLEQKMKLAPRMIQSMEILQLPMLALQERIEQELVSNPVLEVREPETEPSEPAETDSETVDEELEGEEDLVVQDDRSKTEDFERLANIGDDFEEYLARGAQSRAHRSSGERDRKLDAMHNTAARDISLHEYLVFQWSFVDAEPAIKTCGEVIINFIDDDGYLRSSLEELLNQTTADVTVEQMEQALKLVQKLDPPGVGARNLQECLLLQLETTDSKDEKTRLAKELVQHYLKDIEMNRYPLIAKKTGRSIDEIRSAVRLIGKLSPRPGTLVGAQTVAYITPDVIIDYADDGDGGYTVRLADDNMPNLYISGLYRKLLRSGKLDASAREFIQNNIRSARWLIEAIEQRRNTLLRVAQAVLEAQKDFLDYGPQYLKPLPMVEVARKLGIHVGTVSRAVADKYVQTPRGIYPLRYFFSGGTASADGRSISWDGIRAKLREIIDNEDKSSPLSDDQIVEKLKAAGLNIARRTVAKYRKLMNIPPARRRKQF